MEPKINGTGFIYTVPVPKIKVEIKLISRINLPI
jgi:hypothetical protein